MRDCLLDWYVGRFVGWFGLVSVIGSLFASGCACVRVLVLWLVGALFGWSVPSWHVVWSIGYFDE